MKVEDWAARIQWRGRRETFNLKTSNKATAAAKAKDIYTMLVGAGWDSTLEKFKPEMARKSVSTVGDFLTELRGHWSGKPKTFEDYCRSFRQILSEIFDIKGGREKFDYVNGGDVIFTRVASKVDYRNRWTALAVDGVRAALLAKQNASAWVDERIKTATFTVHIWRQLQVKQGDWSAQFVRAKREERLGRAKIECDYHLCRDGSVIAWPAWAEKSKSLPDRLTSNNWQRFLPVVRQLVRIFLQQDEKRMHEYLKASVPKKMEYVEKKGWDAFIFDNFLMKKVKSALESLASR